VAALIRPASPGRARTWRDLDLRWLAVCLVGAIVSAVAAWSVLAGRVPLDAVPPDTVFAVACAILVAEWFIAAVMVAIYPDRAADPGPPAASVAAPEPPARPEPPALTARPEPPVLTARTEPPVLTARPEPPALPPMKPAPVALAPATAKPAAPQPPAPEIEALQERIEHLTAALTLTAAAENLEQVGAIAQQALAEDIQYTRTS